MRWLGLFAVTMLATGCKYSESRYVEHFVEAECAYAMSCYDQAVLTFNGWGSDADCIVERGPQIHDDIAGCVFDPKAARDCVKALEDQGCPAQGGDHVYPEICRDVATSCQDAGDDTDTGHADDTGESDA